MWHADGTRRPCCLCPVGHLSKSCHRVQEAAEKPHRKNSIFKYQDPGQHLLSLGARLAHLRIWPTIALSRPDEKKRRKCPQLRGVFVCFFFIFFWREYKRGSGHSMAQSMSKDHDCCSSPAKSSGCSAAKQAAHYQAEAWGDPLAFRCCSAIAFQGHMRGGNNHFAVGDTALSVSGAIFNVSKKCLNNGKTHTTHLFFNI